MEPNPEVAKLLSELFMKIQELLAYTAPETSIEDVMLKLENNSDFRRLRSELALQNVNPYLGYLDDMGEEVQTKRICLTAKRQL